MSMPLKGLAFVLPAPHEPLDLLVGGHFGMGKENGTVQLKLLWGSLKPLTSPKFNSLRSSFPYDRRYSIEWHDKRYGEAVVLRQRCQHFVGV